MGISSPVTGLMAATPFRQTPVFSLSSAEVLAAVREAVSAHAGGAEQSDDITMLGLVFQG